MHYYITVCPIVQVISLLSPQAFLDIVYQLVAEDSVAKGDIQRKTLEILNSKLEGNRLKFTAQHVRIIMFGSHLE